MKIDMEKNICNSSWSLFLLMLVRDFFEELIQIMLMFVVCKHPTLDMCYYMSKSYNFSVWGWLS